MKRKTNRLLDMRIATKKQAENILNKTINNFPFSDEGYIINGKWIPKEIVDSQSLPYDSGPDIIAFLNEEVLATTKAFSGTKKMRKTGMCELINNMNKLIKILQS